MQEVYAEYGYFFIDENIHPPVGKWTFLILWVCSKIREFSTNFGILFQNSRHSGVQK